MLWFVIPGQTHISEHCCKFQPRQGITEVRVNEDRLHPAGHNTEDKTTKDDTRIWLKKQSRKIAVGVKQP